MRRALTFFLLLFIGSGAVAQSNILLLQKHNKTVKTYFEGKYIAFYTKDNSAASGIITKIGRDTIYIRYFEIIRTATEYGGIYFDTSFRYTTAVHVNDIGAIEPPPEKTGLANRGTLLMVAGGGVLVLGAVNGIYRKENIGEWYKPSGYITAGALAATGFFLRKAGTKKLVIGKKYQLKILSIN